MLVLTVQTRDVVERILSGEKYTPDFSKSTYAYLSPRFTKAYNKTLKELSRKTKKYYTMGVDSCIWGWVGKPFLDFYAIESGSKNSGKYAVFCEIDEKDLVFSDYDKYSDYIEGYTDSLDFMVSEVSNDACIQCAFWSLSKRNIVSIVELNSIGIKYRLSDKADYETKTVSDIREQERVFDVRFKFDGRMAEFCGGM